MSIYDEAPGDAILPDDKQCFNYKYSRARLVTEGVFGRLKSRFGNVFPKCKSNQETTKLHGLAYLVHPLYHASNEHLSQWK